MRKTKIAVVVLLILLAVVLTVQNTEVVTLRFLAWEAAMSQIVLLPLILVLGFVLGFLVAKLGGRKRPA